MVRPRSVPEFANEPYHEPYSEPIGLLPEPYIGLLEEELPAPPPTRRLGPTPMAWAVAATGALVCMAIGVYVVLSREDARPAPAVISASSSSEADQAAATEETVPAETVPETPAPTADTTLLTSSHADLTGTLVGGRILVAGAVRTTQDAAGLTLLLEQVVGAGNVDATNLVVDPAEPTPDRIAIIVGSEVVFAVGADQVEDPFLPVLDNLVTLLEANPDTTVLIEGHADAAGVASENLRLSQKRADAVVDYLAAQGIDRTRLLSIGRGSQDPVADNDTVEGRARNRRIEFVVAGFRLDL